MLPLKVCVEYWVLSFRAFVYVFPERERERQKERQRDRETVRQWDRETERQRDRETEREVGISDIDV